MGMVFASLRQMSLFPRAWNLEALASVTPSGVGRAALSVLVQMIAVAMESVFREIASAIPALMVMIAHNVNSLLWLLLVS